MSVIPREAPFHDLLIFPNDYFPYPGEETVNSIQFECNLSGGLKGLPTVLMGEIV